MKVKIELSNIIFGNKEEIIINDYDKKFFPPRPAGELSSDQMFQYWSKRMLEQNINHSPDYFDMTKNMGVIFEITEVKEPDNISEHPNDNFVSFERF